MGSSPSTAIFRFENPCFAGVSSFLVCCGRSSFHRLRRPVLWILLRIHGTSNGCLEVAVRRLQIMTCGDSLRVAQPIANDVQREPASQVGLSRRPQVVEDLRPRLVAGLLDQFQELPAEVQAAPEAPFCSLRRSPLPKSGVAIRCSQWSITACSSARNSGGSAATGSEVTGGVPSDMPTMSPISPRARRPHFGRKADLGVNGYEKFASVPHIDKWLPRFSESGLASAARSPN